MPTETPEQFKKNLEKFIKVVAKKANVDEKEISESFVKFREMWKRRGLKSIAMNKKARASTLQKYRPLFSVKNARFLAFIYSKNNAYDSAHWARIDAGEAKKKWGIKGAIKRGFFDVDGKTILYQRRYLDNLKTKQNPRWKQKVPKEDLSRPMFFMGYRVDKQGKLHFEKLQLYLNRDLAKEENVDAQSLPMFTWLNFYATPNQTQNLAGYNKISPPKNTPLVFESLSDTDIEKFDLKSVEEEFFKRAKKITKPMSDIDELGKKRHTTPVIFNTEITSMGTKKNSNGSYTFYFSRSSLDDLDEQDFDDVMAELEQENDETDYSDIAGFLTQMIYDEVDYGEYSTVYVIGNPTRKNKKDDKGKVIKTEWLSPTLNVFGIFCRDEDKNGERPVEISRDNVDGEDSDDDELDEDEEFDDSEISDKDFEDDFDSDATEDEDEDDEDFEVD